MAVHVGGSARRAHELFQQLHRSEVQGDGDPVRRRRARAALQQRPVGPIVRDGQLPAPEPPVPPQSPRPPPHTAPAAVRPANARGSTGSGSAPWSTGMYGGRGHLVRPCPQDALDGAVDVGRGAGGHRRFQTFPGRLLVQHLNRDTHVGTLSGELKHSTLQVFGVRLLGPRRHHGFLPHDEVVRDVVAHGRPRIDFHAVDFKPMKPARSRNDNRRQRQRERGRGGEGDEPTCQSALSQRAGPPFRCVNYTFHDGGLCRSREHIAGCSSHTYGREGGKGDVRAPIALLAAPLPAGGGPGDGEAAACTAAGASQPVHVVARHHAGFRRGGRPTHAAGPRRGGGRRHVPALA